MRRIAVVGLGAMGSAALAHLSKVADTEVVGFDPNPPGHVLGSSHGFSRVVRQAYFEHPDYVPLLKRAFELWEALEVESGVPILYRSGVLVAGPPDSEAIRRSHSSALTHGIPVETIASDELRRRFPQFRLPDGYHALLEPGGGFVIPEHGVRAHLDIAHRHGAVRSSSPVTRVERHKDAARVVTRDGAHTFDHVVVTAGAWTDQILPQTRRLRLQPQRQLLVWFEPRDPRACSIDAMPVWMIDHDGMFGDGLYYGVPTWNGQVGPPGVKVGFHGPGVPIAAGLPGLVDPDDVARFARDLAGILPALGAPIKSINCTYTMSPDEHFIVDRLDPSISVACGFSGHGYKFAPVIGELLARFAVGAEPAFGIDFLSSSRPTFND